MTSFRVTPEELAHVSQGLAGGAATIDGTLGRLAGQVGSLQGQWTGAAQARFEALWQEWQRSAKGLHHALTGISQLTAQAANNYDSTEQAVAASFAG